MASAQLSILVRRLNAARQGALYFQADQVFGHYGVEGSAETSLANASVNVHDHLDGLIGDNRERLGLAADMFAHAVLHIQNIRARRQRKTIVSFASAVTLAISFFLSWLKTTRGYSAKVSAVTVGRSSIRKLQPCFGE